MAHLHGVFLEHQPLHQHVGESWFLQKEETAAAMHIKALRLKSGDELFLLNGKGAKTKVKLLDHKTLEFCTTANENAKRPNVSVDVFLSPPKSDDLEQCIQICVELGVQRLHLFKSDHSTYLSDLKLGRLKRIAQSSCEQSLNPWIPEIVDATETSLGEMIKLSQNLAESVLVFDENLAEKDRFFNVTPGPKSFAFFVGPEGGWSTYERKMMESSQIHRASLGPIVLRVPTALCAALSVLRSTT